MRHWLKPRPLLVMALLLAAPLGAIGHLAVTWAPRTLSLHRMTQATRADARNADKHVQLLAQVAQQTEQLAAMSATYTDERPWLPQRDRNGVADALAQAFEVPGVTVEQLTFADAELYAADPDAGVLACERVNIAFRGDYAGLTRCLDALTQLQLPQRITQIAWQRDDRDVCLNLELEVPFAPQGPLERALLSEAGLLEDDEDAL